MEKETRDLTRMAFSTGEKGTIEHQTIPPTRLKTRNSKKVRSTSLVAPTTFPHCFRKYSIINSDNYNVEGCSSHNIDNERHIAMTHR